MFPRVNFEQKLGLGFMAVGLFLAFLGDARAKADALQGLIDENASHNDFELHHLRQRVAELESSRPTEAPKA